MIGLGPTRGNGQETWLDQLLDRFEEAIWAFSLGELEESWDHEFSIELEARQLTLQEVLTGISDESLTWAVKKGFFFHQAFAELFCVRYAQRLTHIFMNWNGGDRQEAEALVQDLHVKFLSKPLESYDPERRSFRAYLFKVAWNL